MLNKILIVLVILSLGLSGLQFWKNITVDQQLASIKDSIDAVRAMAQSTQGQLINEVKPQQELTKTSIVHMKGQIENFNLYVGHERTRRVKIFQVREAIKKTIMRNQHSQYFKETKKLSHEDLYRMATYIVDACEEFDVPMSLYLGLMRQESAFDPLAVSPTGAQGLSQIIPSTARQIQRALNIKEYNAFNMQHNIRFGVYYLSQLLDKFSDNHSNALRAYNAGPDYVDRWLAKEYRRLPAETVAYEQRIMNYAQEYAVAGIR